jgi:ubiquinone/menaquinone biosynthesis C-methylase UbiE
MQEEKKTPSPQETEHEQQLFSWQSEDAASRWAQQSKLRENLFAEATRLMLDAAELRPADHVLDIAAGTGDQSLLAAQIVGPAGTVLATDISAEMLKEATRLAEQQGFTNITTRVMNAEQLDLPDQSFDAVICRLGLMLVQNQDQAFLEIRRVLKPDRKLAALVWSTPECHPLLSIPLTLIAKYVPEPSQLTNAFSLAGPPVFEQALRDAGFRSVSVQPVSIQFRFASIEALFQQIPGNLVTSTVAQFNPSDRQRFLEEFAQALHQFEGPHGLLIPAELLLGVATR